MDWITQEARQIIKHSNNTNQDGFFLHRLQQAVTHSLFFFLKKKRGGGVGRLSHAVMRHKVTVNPPSAIHFQRSLTADSQRPEDIHISRSQSPKKS